MQSEFYKGLGKEDQKGLRAAAYSGRPALERLIVIAERDIDRCVKDMLNPAHFEGDWSLKQASLVAEVAVNKKLIQRLKKVIDNLSYA